MMTLSPASRAMICLVAVLTVGCVGSREPQCISYPPAPQGSEGIKNAVPVLRSTNVERSLDYYVNVLGFARDWAYRWEPGSELIYASVSRDGASLHLSKNIPKRVVAYFYVNGVDELHDEWKAANAEIMYDPHVKEEGPVDQPWGMREIHLADPDGNVLKFGELLRD